MTKEGLTVTNLLAELAQKIDAIEAKYADIYESLGRKFFSNKDNPTHWVIREAIAEIDRAHTEQARLRTLIWDLEKEARTPPTSKV